MAALAKALFPLSVKHFSPFRNWYERYAALEESEKESKRQQTSRRDLAVYAGVQITSPRTVAINRILRVKIRMPFSAGTKPIQLIK